MLWAFILKSDNCNVAGANDNNNCNAALKEEKVKIVIRNFRFFRGHCFSRTFYSYKKIVLKFPQKKWDSLFRRADIRAAGEKPPTRGKHWRAKAKNPAPATPANQDTSSQETRAKILKQENAEAVPHSGEAKPEIQTQHAQGKLSVLTQFVDTSTDLPKLLLESFPVDSGVPADVGHNFGIVGLHTCGNLASDSLRIFLTNARCKFCVNVGCCYHHLNEEFFRNLYETEEVTDACNANPGFPLSRVLREKKFQLGRNARMIAAQPVERMADKKQVGRSANTSGQQVNLKKYSSQVAFFLTSNFLLT